MSSLKKGQWKRLWSFLSFVFEGRISYIRAACNYHTRNVNFESRISDIRLQIIVRYQPKKIRRRSYEQKLNENDQYATQSRENESRFHYLCSAVGKRTKFEQNNIVETTLNQHTGLNYLCYRVQLEWKLCLNCSCYFHSCSIDFLASYFCLR